MDSIRLRVSGSAVIVVLEMSYDLTSNTRRKRNISEQTMSELIQLRLHGTQNPNEDESQFRDLEYYSELLDIRYTYI